jgi:hypothetical protein
MIHVSEQEIVNWPIPVASILVPGNAIPPITVETSVGETCELRQNIQTALPNHIPGKELFEKQGKEDLKDYPRKFAPAFGECESGIFHSYGFDDGRIDVGL